MTDQPSPTQTVALVGAKGMLARAVARQAGGRYEVVGYDLPEFDLTDREAVLRTLGELRPQVIANCAAFTDVDGCEGREELATRVNGDGPGHLAEAAREVDATLVHLSTDYVFDGEATAPYREDDPTGPRSAYGRSKLAGERAVLASGLERLFIVRTSWLYGPGGRNFVETMIRLAREREELRVVADQVGCPTYTEDLAEAILNLLALDQRVHESRITSHQSPVHGLYHFSNEGSVSWHGFAEAIVARLREREPVRARRVVPLRTEEYPTPARRPAYSVLSKEKYETATGAAVPAWEEALDRYFRVRAP